MQAIRVTGEAKRDEFMQEAFWSYRANVPMAGEGKNREVIPFRNWFAQLTGQAIERKEPELPEISDEEIEFLMKAGRQKFKPPGM